MNATTTTQWNNLSVEGCARVVSILTEVHKQTGSLPGGKSPDKFQWESPCRLLDCAQTVSEDDGIWAQTPEATDGVRREELRSALVRILAELR